MQEFEGRSAPRWVKLGLSAGSGMLFVVGLVAGLLFRAVFLGVLLFALGAILFALRGYLTTGDRVVSGALIFVAIVAVGIETIVFFLAP